MSGHNGEGSAVTFRSNFSQSSATVSSHLPLLFLVFTAPLALQCLAGAPCFGGVSSSSFGVLAGTQDVYHGCMVARVLV